MELNIYRVKENQGLLDTYKYLDSLKRELGEHVVSDGLIQVSEMCYREYFNRESMWEKYSQIEAMLSPLQSEKFEKNQSDQKISTPSAIVFLKVDEYWYALTFGLGRHYLDINKMKPGWGTSIILNLYTKGKGTFTSVKSHQLDMYRKHAKTDIQNGSELAMFGIDSYRAIIDGIKLKLNVDNYLFKGTISGFDNILLSTKSDDLVGVITQLESNYVESLNIDVLNNIIKLESGAEFDGVEESLNRNRRLLIKGAEVNLPHKALSFDWYTPNNIYIRKKQARKNMVNNASFEDILKTVKDVLEYSLDIESLEINDPIRDVLDGYVVRIKNQDGSKYNDFAIYDCLSYSFCYNDEEYVLDEGDIFRFKKNLLERINNDYRDLLKIDKSILLPPIPIDYLEGQYNELLSEKNDEYYLLDKKNVQLTGRGKFEIADVLVKKGDEYLLIHNKGTYKSSVGSSCISHLSRQIECSLLYLTNNLEGDIKSNIDKVLDNLGVDIDDFYEKLRSKKVKLIAGIVTTNDQIEELPDFSKATLVELNKRILSNNFSLELINIDRES